MRFFLKQLIFLTLWSSGPALALGLGDIRLYSYLNEPLDAEIRLLSADNASPGSIEVRAVGNGSERLGYEPGSFSPRSLRFKLLYPQGRAPVIKVTSTSRVREPVVTFVLELIGPQASIQRDYTLLMDPPPYIANAMLQGREVLERARIESTPESPPERKRLETRATSETYGPVRGGETLSQIALRTRPSRGISIHRMTQALYRRNPDAFIDGNINLLRQGAHLQVPGPEAFHTMGNRQDTRPQATPANATTRPVRARQAVTAKKDPTISSAAKQPPTAKEGGENRDVLRLLSAGDTVPDSSRSGVRAKGVASEMQEVSQQLQSVREQNRVLRERIAQMEVLLRRMREQAERMLVAQRHNSTAGKAGPRPGPAPETRQLAQSENLDTESRALDQPPVQSSWTRTLLSWLWWVSLGLAVALVVVALLLLRSKDETARAREAALTETDQDAEALAKPEHWTRQAPDVSNVPTEEVVIVNEPPEKPVPGETEPEFLTYLRTEIDTNAAYGRYAAAKKALDRALEIAPTDIELMVKAFELARLQEDAESFTAWINRAGEDVARRAPAIWESISKEGRNWIPDHPVWRQIDARQGKTGTTGGI